MAAADRLSGSIAKNKDGGSVPPDSQSGHTTTPPIARSIAPTIAMATRQLIRLGAGRDLCTKNLEGQGDTRRRARLRLARA